MSFNITFETLLQEVLDRSSSDLHISLGAPAMLRVDGTLQPTQQAPEHILTADESKALCFRHCTPEMIKELEAKRELDFSFELHDFSEHYQ